MCRGDETPAVDCERDQSKKPIFPSPPSSRSSGMRKIGVENMPPQVFDTPTRSMTAVPKKTGPVYMHHPMGNSGSVQKARVVLSVYCNNYDRFAVVSQDKVFCKDCGYITLRKSTVKALEGSTDTFQILPRNCEGQALTFSVKDSKQLQSWVAFLQTVCGGTGESSNIMDCRSRPKFTSRRPLQPLATSRAKSLPQRPFLPSLAEEDTINEE